MPRFSPFEDKVANQLSKTKQNSQKKWEQASALRRENGQQQESYI
jgi:hypothetical protein